MAGGTAKLTWTPSPSPTVTGYSVLYTDNLSNPGYSSIRTATADNETEIGGLDPTKVYRFCVVGYDDRGNATPQSNAATLVPCPAANLFGGQSFETNLLRRFKDEVLHATPEGSMLAELYYKHAAELTKIMASDVALRQETKALLLHLLPLVQQVLDGKGLLLSRADKNAIDSLCSRIADKATPELRHALEDFREKLKSDRVL